MFGLFQKRGLFGRKLHMLAYPKDRHKLDAIAHEYNDREKQLPWRKRLPKYFVREIT